MAILSDVHMKELEDEGKDVVMRKVLGNSGSSRVGKGVQQWNDRVVCEDGSSSNADGAEAIRAPRRFRLFHRISEGFAGHTTIVYNVNGSSMKPGIIRE